MTVALAPSESEDTYPLENPDLLLEIARALVDAPEHVQVEEREMHDGTRLVLKAAKQDRGKLIGRGGETIDHIRAIFNKIARADRTHIFIEVEDENTGRPRRKSNGRRVA